MVNRKQPSAPAALSRSSSSQPVATTSAARKAQSSQLKNQVSNGNGSATSKANKQSLKKKKAATQKKSGSFIDRFFLLFLSSFIAYSVFSCRPNPIFATPSSTPPSALCRSLHSYNVNVLEPYVIPPIIKTYEFSKPYLQELKAHADPYLAPVQEKVEAVRPYLAPISKAVVTAFDSYLVPFSRTVIHHWKVSVVPRYKRHIHPRLQPAIRSFQHKFDLYVTVPFWNNLEVIQEKLDVLYLQHLEPYVAQVRPHLQTSWKMTHEVLHSLSNFYNAQLHPMLLDTWTQLRPYLCSLLKTSKAFASKAFSETSVASKKAVKEGAVLRRQYVDPHLGKIWDKVSASQNADDAFATDIHVATSNEEAAPNPTSESEIAPTPTNEPEASTTLAISSTVDAPDNTELANPSIPTPEEVVLDQIPTPEITPAYSEQEREQAQHAVDVAEESAGGASTVVYELEREAEKVGATVPHSEPSVTPELEVSAPLQPSPTDAPAPTPEDEVPTLRDEEVIEEPVTPPPAPSASILDIPEDEEDIDDFLRELGVSESTVTAGSTESATGQAPPSTPTPSEEAVAAAKESTRLKRLNITERHQKWFGKLEALVPVVAKQLVEKLKASRLQNVQEVSKMINGENKRDGKIDAVALEGEKLIRGLESYLKKAIAKRSAWAPMPEDDTKDPTPEEIEKYQSISTSEKNKWSKVVSRVDEKFSEKVRGLEGEVYDWYTKVRDAENQEVYSSTLEVKAMAEQAQGDIGLDYAWLDDVTYRDWQKYHDLMRVYENYTQIANQLVNGTEITVSFSDFSAPPDLPSPPADPLVPLLDKLYSELQDVVLGFNIALNNVRVKALKVYSLRPKIALDENGEVANNSGDDNDGFFVVKDGQKRKDDLRGVDLGGLGLAKPKEGGKLAVVEDEQEQVVILPIGDGEKREEKKSDDEFDPATILVGKDPVQIQEALKDVPVEPAAARHEEL